VIKGNSVIVVHHGQPGLSHLRPSYFRHNSPLVFQHTRNRRHRPARPELWSSGGDRVGHGGLSLEIKASFETGMLFRHYQNE